MHILVIRDYDIVAILVSAVLIQEKEKETLTHRLFNTVNFRNKKKKKPSRSGVVHVVVWWRTGGVKNMAASVGGSEEHVCGSTAATEIIRNRRDACRERSTFYTV